jgi:shikimate kinase
MDNLVLVGFSCSGKTTIGRFLARRLHLRFVDTDRLIEQTAGRSIPEIFSTEGEAAFRALEREAVARVCAEDFQVISTGGGAFVDPRNRQLLREGNLVVYLRVRPATVVQRLRSSKGGRPRPLLDAPDPLQRVTELMAARRRSYGCAHLGIDVDERSAHSVAAEIVRRWYAWRRTRSLAHGPVPGARQEVDRKP